MTPEQVVHVKINYSGPGVSSPERIAELKRSRSPYDISTWGSGCGRGIPYQDLGVTVDGQAGAVRKLGGGRKKAAR